MKMQKNRKICVVCGKYFDCPPSSKKVTCGPECSRINKSRTHKGKHNVWNQESRDKLKEKGKTENLSKGTEAAKKSPKSGRFKTNVNAKIWKLVSPEGNTFVVKNLTLWARENCALFGVESTEENAFRIMAGLKHAKQGADGKRYAQTITYKGWRAETGTEKEYYGNADMTKLPSHQQSCPIDYLNGIKAEEIAEKS